LIKNILKTNFTPQQQQQEQQKIEKKMKISALNLLFKSCNDDVCLKTNLTVFSDKIFLIDFIAFVDEATVVLNQNYNSFFNYVIDNKTSNKNSNKNKNNSGNVDYINDDNDFKNSIKIIEISLNILKFWIFSEHFKNILCIEIESIVLKIAAILNLSNNFFKFLQKKNAKKNENIKKLFEKNFENISEFCVETLLGLSQHTVFQTKFSTRISSSTKSLLLLPLNTTVDATTTKINNNEFYSAITEVFSIIEQQPNQLSNCLAILINACLETSSEVRKEVHNSGGFELATSSMLLSDEAREKISVDDGLVLTRKISLLSRLVAITDIQKKLMQDLKLYRVVCQKLTFQKTIKTFNLANIVSKQSNSKNIAKNIDNNNSNNNDTIITETITSIDKWRIDEVSSYLRVLASLTNPTNECKKIAMQENILESLLAFFPTPREDGGEITALSVTLMPFELQQQQQQAADVLLLGNAARCLIPYADDVENFAKTLFLEKKFYCVEKLICAMANCVDMRVRKNIAILLAKGCRVQGVREKITKFRGMQMMIELQDKL
jgi:hypothetical protein